jgi:MFS family permease
VTISAAAIIAQITHPGDRKRVLGGIWAAYFPIGFGSFLLIAPIVVDSYGWRVLWQAGSVITLLWLPVFWRATGDLPAERRQGGGPGLFRNIALTLARPGALLVAACFALYAAQHVAFVIWLPTMIIDARGTSLFIAAAVPAAVLAFNAGGIIFGGWVMGRGVPVWLLMVIGGVGMGIAEFGIFSGAAPDGARLVLAMMFGLFGGLIPAASLAAAPVYTPSPAQIGTINGLLVMATNTGQLFGPPALAAVKEAEGSWESTSWLMLSLAAAIVALALISRPVERKAEMRLKG